MLKLSILALCLVIYQIHATVGQEKSPGARRGGNWPDVQDCWDGNRCLRDNHCGNQGKCVFDKTNYTK